MRSYGNTFCAWLLLVASLATATAQRLRANTPATAIPTNTLLRIIRAEDERRWDVNLKSLLTDRDANVRKRAALAAGRVGDERAVPALVDLLRRDTDNHVRQMAAFAIGEIESAAGADALIDMLGAVARPSGRAPEVGELASDHVRARAVEALGKIAAALPDSEKDRKRTYAEAILKALRFEDDRRSRSYRLTILLGLTAALRAKPDGAGPVVARFLGYAGPRIVADALNTLARLRLKDGNDDARRLLAKHADPIVRANAARVLGATEDKQAFDALLDRSLHDDDLRVRVSAIRALGALKDARAARPLLERGETLFVSYRTQKKGLIRTGNPSETNELREIATTLGRVQPYTNDEHAVDWLHRVRDLEDSTAVEVEIALARLSPGNYVLESSHPRPQWSWRTASAIAQGLGEVSAIPVTISDQTWKIEQTAQAFLLRMLCWQRFGDAQCQRVPDQAVPDVLRAYAKFKSEDLPKVLEVHLNQPDVIVRATTVELLGELKPDETNSRALIDALKAELPRTEKGEMNDAALAILDALAKQKSAAANDAIKTALDSSDHLIRRKAVALLKANGAGDFSNRIGTVHTRNTEAAYRRAIARIGKQTTATVVTNKGSFTIEFLPADAPLTVDNFVQLARKGYFNGQTIPRVVPNFVIQAGDPRGDTNGGPGYQIRCEINEVPYDRAAVGMALSGKDTGGSQWFVTHSPQPHLDGGYTVFGRVVSGMDVVDRIARGDTIRRVIVNER